MKTPSPFPKNPPNVLRNVDLDFVPLSVQCSPFFKKLSHCTSAFFVHIPLSQRWLSFKVIRQTHRGFSRLWLWWLTARWVTCYFNFHSSFLDFFPCSSFQPSQALLRADILTCHNRKCTGVTTPMTARFYQWASMYNTWHLNTYTESRHC